VLTSLAVLVGLTGCASGAADVPPAATARAPHPASAISNPAVKPGVVATGALTSQDGKTSGHIVVTARDDGDFDVTFSDFHTSTTGDLQLELSAVPFNSAVSCFADTGLKVNLNAVSPGTYLLAGGVDPIHGDPSFLHTALLTQPVIPVASGKCLNTVVGSASLAWTLPDMRPNLHVVDSGIRTGGTGVVTMVDGKPASYAVAPDDVMKAIAERFGITVDDILYLNPTRMGGTMALAGETLNLSKKLR
jgi:LysM repeat protein